MDSITELHIPRDDLGFVFDAGSLFAELEGLTDRRDPRGVRYPLPVVLVLIVLAKLAGEDTAAGVAEWVRLRQGWLVELFELRRPAVPHATTYRRCLAQALEVEELERVVGAFLRQRSREGQAEVVALDGKTLRGTIPRGRDNEGVHLLAAYQPGEGVVLVQVAVESKENEIVAAPRVLEGLDLSGQVVTGDALLAQRALSSQIVKAGGDYLWKVKQNQPATYQAIAELFEPQTMVLAKGFSAAPTDFRTAYTINKAHGRIEERWLTSSSLLADYLDWPAAGQVFKLVYRARKLSTGQIQETVTYGLTSLTAGEATPRRLLHLVRQHWGIENGLHYRRDKTLHEDAARICHPGAAQAMAVLNNLVVGLVLGQGFSNLAQARRRFNARPLEALNLVFH